MSYVVPDLHTHTLRVVIGAVHISIHADDAQIFANLLRRPPASGLVWLDALDPEYGVRLRALNHGTELTCMRGAEQVHITWTVSVDVAGDITGGLGRLKLARVAG
jgi:hypothetical protein